MTPHQRQEPLQRLAAGEMMADVARTYNVDATIEDRKRTPKESSESPQLRN